MIRAATAPGIFDRRGPLAPWAQSEQNGVAGCPSSGVPTPSGGLVASDSISGAQEMKVWDEGSVYSGQANVMASASEFAPFPWPQSIRAVAWSVDVPTRRTIGGVVGDGVSKRSVVSVSST